MKKSYPFSRLDKRRKMMLLSNANALAVAIQLIEKLGTRAMARQILTGGLHSTNLMSDEEIDQAIAELDQKMSESPNITGIHTLLQNSYN
jgi:hypothetical protein